MVSKRLQHVFRGHHFARERLQEGERHELGFGALEPLTDVGELGFRRERAADGLARWETDLQRKLFMNRQLSLEK